MRIQVDKANGIHNLAQCRDCKWQHDVYLDKGSYGAIYKHVRMTGHTVTREVANSTRYSPEK